VSADRAPATRQDFAPEVRVPDDANIAQLAAGWISAAGSRVKSTAELALAEAKLAVLSVVLMLLLAIVVAVFLLSAWGLLIAGAVSGLLALGVPLWGSLAVLGTLHLFLAWLLLRWISRLSTHLELPATRRQLSAADGQGPSDAVA
jgi:uncharacterized membrane protein YqjE